MQITAFLTDVVAGLIGTMVGVFLGVRLEGQRTRREDAAHDRRLVQNLIDRLAGKRAFGHPTTLG